jgi:hypothetical protein
MAGGLRRTTVKRGNVKRSSGNTFPATDRSMLSSTSRRESGFVVSPAERSLAAVELADGNGAVVIVSVAMIAKVH